MITEHVAAERVRGRLRLPAHEGRLRARLFHLGAVVDEEWTDAGELLLRVDMRRRDLERLHQKEGLGAPLEPE